MMDTDTRQNLNRGTLIAGCLAVCLAQIGLAIPATLNGLFQSDLHPVGSQLTWISDAFLLPTAVLELTFGVLGDLFGRKRLLVGGAFMMAIGETVAASAPGVHQLWAGQALTGIGAAAVFPSSLAVIAAGTHNHRDRSRGIAAWAGSLSAGGAIAPVLGGITGNYGSWRWSFIVVTIIAVISTIVSHLFVRDSSAPAGRALDWGGQITIAVGLFALLFGVIQGQGVGWSAPQVIVAFIVAAAFLVLFILAERRAVSPMLRLELFRNRSFAMAAAIAVIGMFSFLGTAYAVSIRMGPIQHQSPLRTAVPFLFLNGLTPVVAPLTSRLLQGVPPRWLLTGGLAAMAGGQLWMSTLPVDNTSLGSLVVPLGLVGLGFALLVSAITAAAVNTVPLRFAGMAAAATSLLRDLGMTLGPAIIGAVALGRAATSFTHHLAAAPLSPEQKAAVLEVAKEGGPLAVGSVPPGSPPAVGGPIAPTALAHGYSIGFVVCAIAAAVAAILAGALLRGRSTDIDDPRTFVDPVAGQAEPVPT